MGVLLGIDGCAQLDAVRNGMLPNETPGQGGQVEYRRVESLHL